VSIRDIIDFSDFVIPEEAIELVQHTIRRAFQYDWFSGRKRFTAIVLTEPIPMQTEDIELFTNVPKPSVADDIRSFFGLSRAPRRISKFTFHTRILGYNSPHIFLPDPCDPNSPYQSNPAALLKLIALHTRCTSTEEYSLQSGKKLPNRGDLVLIDLEYGDNGYNLQEATFVDVILPTDGEHNIDTYVGSACNTSLAASFAGAGSAAGAGGGGGSRGAYRGGTQNLAINNGGLNAAGLIQPSSVGYLKGHPRLLKDVVGDWDALATAFNAHFASEGLGWKLAGSGDRSYQGQVDARARWCAKGNCSGASTPGFSNHGWGVAVDTHYYDKDGKKKSLSSSGPAYEWLFKNSPIYGWEHPYWAQDPAVSARLGNACVPPAGKRYGSNAVVWHFESSKRDQFIALGSKAYTDAQPPVATVASAGGKCAADEIWHAPSSICIPAGIK